MLYGLLAVVLMAMDHRGHYVPRVRSAAEYAVEPLYHVVEWPIRAVRNLYGQFQSNRTLRQRNEELQRQLLGQQAELQRLATLQEENRRLRALFEGAESLAFEYRFAELVRVDLGTTVAPAESVPVTLTVDGRISAPVAIGVAPAS